MLGVYVAVAQRASTATREGTATCRRERATVTHSYTYSGMDKKRRDVRRSLLYSQFLYVYPVG